MSYTVPVRALRVDGEKYAHVSQVTAPRPPPWNTRSPAIHRLSIRRGEAQLGDGIVIKPTTLLLAAATTLISGIGVSEMASADPNIAKQRRIDKYKAMGYGQARINALEAQREKRLQAQVAKRNARKKALARAKRRQIHDSYVRPRHPDFEIRRRQQRTGVRRFRRFERQGSGFGRFGRVRSPFRGGFRRRR